jgi:hypothetical protein
LRDEKRYFYTEAQRTQRKTGKSEMGGEKNRGEYGAALNAAPRRFIAVAKDLPLSASGLREMTAR